MERIFLYYPSIAIPNNEWLYNSILYSDKIASILPYRELDYLPDLLKFLLDNNEYHPIFVQDFLNKNETEFTKFEDKFIKAIDNDRFFLLDSKTRRDKRFEEIYYTKMSEKVLHELDKRKLIIKEFNKCILPENAAIYYMCILSQFIAQLSTKII